MAAGPESKSPVKLIITIVVVVLLVILAGVGVLTVIAVSASKTYVSRSKEAEGRAALSMMMRGAVRCFDHESPATELLGGNEAAKLKALPATTKPVPASLSSVGGTKYQSRPGEWSEPGYLCMRFSMTEPQYFQYQWQRDSDTTGRGVARADFDGDGQPEVTFEQKIDCNGGVCRVDPNVIETR